MKTNIQLLALLLLTGILGCRDQLDIPNPNRPTPASAMTEQGVMALAQGALYVNGTQATKFGGNFFATVVTWHERMGDAIGSLTVPAEPACPDNITLDNGTNLVSIHPAGQKHYLKSTNIPSNAATVLSFEWAQMYSLNGAMNAVLANVPQIAMTDSKKSTLQAWAYFWKGFAYSRIGSMYYAGIINDEFNKTNNKYVTSADILAEAESNFKKAETIIQSLIGDPDYTSTLALLIPSICKVGKGFPLSTSQWLSHINTLRARNILVNTPTAAMTTTQWDQIITLTTNGIKQFDNTFTVRTDALGNLLGPNNFTAAGLIGPAASGGGFGAKVSERLIQEFKPGDKRLANNFTQISPYLAPGDRGTANNTRYIIVNKGKGMGGVVVLVDNTVGATELYIAGTYEENVLMLAEANINKGNIDAGLAKIDELRTYQGAGLAATAGTGLTLAQAKEELRRERRVALAFRGYSFYDARRWGVLKNGRTGCVVVDFSGNVSTNATITYGYLGYWDVSVAEFFFNPPSADSAPIVNPD